MSRRYFKHHVTKKRHGEYVKRKRNDKKRNK